MTYQIKAFEKTNTTAIKLNCKKLTLLKYDYLGPNNETTIILEIRFVERGICPIAVCQDRCRVSAFYATYFMVHVCKASVQRN